MGLNILLYRLRYTDIVLHSGKFGTLVHTDLCTILADNVGTIAQLVFGTHRKRGLHEKRVFIYIRLQTVA